MSERPTTGDRERMVPWGGAAQHCAAATAEALEARPGKVIHWGRGRLRQTLPRVVSRCMSYSASPEFDEALMAAVSRFYGVDVDVATAETDILEDDFERVRFFPWFLWDFPLPHGDEEAHEEPIFATVGGRFLEQAELSGFEREVLKALTGSALTFVEIMAVDADKGEIVVLDLAKHTRVEVYDPALAADLEVGHVALVRLIRWGAAEAGDAESSRPDGGGTIDALYAVLPHETRPLVEMELERLMDGSGEPLMALKAHGPEILDFAEHVLSTLTEPPVPLNADQEPIMLCHTVVPRGQEGLVEDLVAVADGTFAREGEAWVWREDERVVALVAREAGRLAVMASSRERFERVGGWLAHAGAALPALRAEVTIDAAGQAWLASERRPVWLLDPEVEASVRRSLGRWLSRWPDEPHPAIDGRTPRAMAREAAGREVVARLIARARVVAGGETVILEDWLARTPLGG